MAWKSKITAIEQNVEKITITYDILNDSNVVVEQGQQIIVSNPTEATLTSLKAQLIDKAKKMSLAYAKVVELTPAIGAVLDVD